MKSRLTLIIALLIVTISLAQNGINYKAIVKNGSGNILASSPVTLQFFIYDGNQTAIYEESHALNTDANGLVMANIGEGAVGDGDFSSIDWDSDDHYLKVEIDTGDGLVDMGFMQFGAVPYALHAETADIAENVTGLEAIDEGNGIGWRLVGQNPNNSGDIGNYALDLSTQFSSSTSTGATGTSSVAIGIGATASGERSTAIGSYTTATGVLSSAIGVLVNASGGRSIALGNGTTASGDSSTAMGSGTMASGLLSTALGSGTTASGEISTALGNGTTAIGDFTTAFGWNTIASSYASMAIGRYNVGLGNNTNWIFTNPLFEIGNGTSNANRKNALTVLKNGKLGIGIIQPSAHLHIEGETTSVALIASTQGSRYAPDIVLGAQSSANDEDEGVISTDPSAPNSDLWLMSHDAVIVRLDQNNTNAGNFEVRNGQNNIVFSINESGNATLSGSLTQNSDKRLKKSITDLPYGLNEVLQLEPKSYNWKNREEDKKSLGLIAQDVQPIIKEIVNTSDDEMKTLGISYTELIPVLINAIKQQQLVINKQAAQNKKQQITLISMLDRIDRLEALNNQ